MAIEIIAELGQTMEGSVERAIEGVHAFADAGATGIKVQWLQPKLIASDAAARYWETNDAVSQSAAFAKAGMIAYDKWAPVLEACEDAKVEFITTPFDLEAVLFWLWYKDDGYPIRTLKVASGDITNHMLLDAVGEAADRVILSTGGATLDEIGRAVDVLIGTHSPDPESLHYGVDDEPRCEVVLLACSLEYPTPAERANLRRIRTLIDVPPLCGPAGTRFPVGYSDHTEGNWGGHHAVLCGATLVEKHVTLGGDPTKVADHAMGLLPDDFAEYADGVWAAQEILGDGVMGVHEGEHAAVQGARRGLYASQTIEVGDFFTDQNVIAKRPAPIIDVHAGAEYWFAIAGTASPCRYDKNEPILRSP